MIGHRGAGASRGKRPKPSVVHENTLLSFETARRRGVSFIELDVQLTRDNVPIVWHDFCFTLRLGPGSDDAFKIPVADVDLSTLRRIAAMQLDAGSAERASAAPSERAAGPLAPPAGESVHAVAAAALRPSTLSSPSRTRVPGGAVDTGAGGSRSPGGGRGAQMAA